jgi:hypothetical protein
MKESLLAFLTAFVLTLTSLSGTWDESCAGCYNDMFAYSKVRLLAKYKTKREFIRAAKTTSNPAMKYISRIEEVANELYRK